MARLIPIPRVRGRRATSATAEDLTDLHDDAGLPPNRGVAQQRHRPLNSASHQPRVWRFAERLLERTLEVPHRHQGIAGERGHIERLGIVPVNSVTCSHQAGEVGAIHRGNPWPEQAALKCRAGATAGTRSSGTCPSPRPSRPCGPAPPRPRRPRPAASRWRRCRGAPCWRSPRQQRRRHSPS